MPAPAPVFFPEFAEITVTSTLDGSPEPSLLYLPEQPKALVVGLHTWSADRYNQQKSMLPHCRERGWALVLPEFRGPNLDDNPRAGEAGGSPLARRDIVDAARYVLKTYADRFPENPPVFLVGGSGGGHMSLQVGAREDFPWTAISSWCPITDVSLWETQSEGYRPHIHAVCGGAPEDRAEEYCERSPIHAAEGLRRYRVQVHHGRYDKVVPYVQTELLIEKLKGADQFYYSIFDGAHELRYPEAFAFFDRVFKADGNAQQLTS